MEWFGGLLELTVPVYNINEGFNEEIVRKSETLSGYAAFIASVRRYLSSDYTLEKAIEQAVRDCLEKDILAEFMLAHASEVINMLTLEFKLEEAMEVWKEECLEEGMEKGIEKGREKGREEGREEVARSMLADGLSRDAVKKYTGLDEGTILSLK
jgi:predicted transposase/invertase (TIGR01784 family)